jgi:RNA polymerase sigma-70 factor (ECF subfamily)
MDALAALAGHRELEDDEAEDLATRIDDQRAGRALLARMQSLPELERAALELVDLDGLAPREAAAALGISRGALRVRLFRARTRLRTTQEPS